MNDKYIIVQWPESQYFLDRDDCCLINTEPFLSIYGSSAYFVPEKVYTLVIENLTKF